MDNKNPKIVLYSTSFCSNCLRVKAFFDERNVRYENVDIDKTPQAVSVVEKINDGNRSVPTIIVTYEEGEDKILIEPSRDQLEEVFLDRN